MKLRSVSRFCAALLLGIGLCHRSSGFEKASHPKVPEIDKRNAPRGKSQTTPKQADDLRKLQRELPGAKVDFHPVHGSPQWVRNSSGFLQIKDERVRGPRFGAAPANDPALPVKEFVSRYPDLFGHDASALVPTSLTRQYTNSHNGVRTFAWDQRLDGIAVAGAAFLGHTTAKGDLIAVSSTFVPDVDQAADAGTPNRLFLEANPPLSAEAAVIIAANAIGEAAGDVATLDAVPDGAGKRQRFSVTGLPGETVAKLAWLPMSPSEMRLCWQIELTRRMGGERHRVLVEVQSGDVLLSRCLTVYASDASFLVFTGDSPTPLSPAYPNPSTNQPAMVPRQLVTFTSLFTNASPLGWINDGENQTRGNNVDAHLDRNADDEPDLPRPQGSPGRVFAPQQDLTQSPVTYGDASVAQLFYWGNWMHDQLYTLGFDEAAGNFQKDNFGRGGVDGDPVMADAQDGSGFNNANWTPTEDGVSPRVQMYLFSGPNPQRDGALDAEVVLHEFTHGLSTRLVGGGVGIDALQTGGMGEGWSDFCALALLSKPGDDVDGVYPMGGYATYQLSGMTQNYYYGIRRYPYTTDMTKNPLTLVDIDPTRTLGHPGVPVSPIDPFNPLFADEVHAQGEIWCVTLWDARANLIRKHGFALGNRMILQLVVDGMKLGPANPDFLQARDAILLADEIDNSGANLDELWAAFSKRGMGFSARVPTSAQTAGVDQAFDLPDQLTILPRPGFFSGGPQGGPFFPECMTYVITNRSSNSMSWSVTAKKSWLTLSADGGILAPRTGTNVMACIDSSAASLAAGIFRDTLVFSNKTTGATQTRAADLRIMEIAQIPVVDGFETGQFEKYWLVTGTGDDRTVVTPTDSPHSGSFHVTMDTFGSGNYARNELTVGVDLAGYTNVVLRFWARNIGDEPDGPAPIPFFQGADFDGVAISQDGVYWYEVQELQSLPLTNREYVVSLDDAVANFGLSYNSAFRIRFNHYDNFGIPFDGIALDDISITGTPIYRVAVTSIPSVTEGDGTLSGAGVITLAAPVAHNLVVQLSTSDPARLRVPASIVIPAGALSTSFDITVINDTLLNGSSTVSVQAIVPGYFSKSAIVVVNDDETAGLRLRIPSKANEGDGLLNKAGNIRLSQRADVDVKVALFASDPSIVILPEAVIVPAGSSSADFDLRIGDDQRLTGSRLIHVAAHVENWIDDSADILIGDNDSPALVLVLPGRIGERDGTVPQIASVLLSGFVESNVVVSLVSSTPTQLSAPATVLIPAGQISAAFDLTAIDDAIVNGVRTISISASATGFASDTGSVDLVDDESAPAPFDPTPADGATGVPLTTTLAWHGGFGEQVVNGGFETGDFTGWTLQNFDYGTFAINDGKVDPEGPENPTAPYGGKFGIVTSQIGSGKHMLSQDLFLPAEARTARLSWADRIRNYATDFVPFATEFRVEVRDPFNNLLETVFVTEPGDKLLNDWVQRSFDISRFRGQTIRLAFIEQDLTSYFNLHLDNISVSLEGAGTISSDVYFGTTPVFKPSDFRGTTTNGTWTLPALALDTTYYWQIIERLGSSARTGPVWRFRTRGVGSVDHLEWSAIPLGAELNVPFPVTVTAFDDIGNIATNDHGTIKISGIAGPTTVSTILVTEIDTGSNDSIEFQNVSGRDIDLSGWKLSLWDARSWPTQRVVVTIPGNTICSSRSVFQLLRQGTAPGAFPTFFTGGTIFWNNNVVGNPVAVMVRDSNDTVVDFVCAYGADPSQITQPFAIPRDQWLGDAVPANTNGLLAFQRVGQIDHNNASDWITAAPSAGRQNSNLRMPFNPLNPIPLTPSLASLSSGVWTGQMTIQQVVSNLTLLADDGANHVGFSTRLDVESANDLALGLEYGPDRTIPGTDIVYLLSARNSGPLPATGVLITNHVPEAVQFVSATPSQGQCGVLNGILFCSLGTLEAGSNATVKVVVTSTAPGPLTNVFGVERDGPDPYAANNIVVAVSTVDLPLIAINDVTVTEGNSGTVDAVFRVRLSTESTLPVSVSFATSNRTATAGLDYIASSGTVVFPPGSTNQTLVIKCLGDTLYEASETFEIDLFSPVNAAIIDNVGVGRMLNDDPLPTIQIANAIVTEPAPGSTTMAAFDVSISVVSGLPVTVDFSTTNGTAIGEYDYLPQNGQVTIPVGSTNAQIAIPIFGDRTAENPETFSVTLSAPVNAVIAFGLDQAKCTILDNGFAELDHFNVGAVPSPQYAGLPFAVSVAAQDARSNFFSGFSGRTSIKAVLPQPEVVIGTGTNSWNNPFATLYHDARSQIIYRADELGGPGNLSGLALFVTTPPGQTLSNWTIRLKHTALAKYSKPAWEDSGWMTVYQNDETVTATGWRTFIFTQPFAYNGTSNLMVDFSFNNSAYSADGAVQYSATAENRTIHFRTDSAFGDPLSWVGTNSPPPIATNALPNLRLFRENDANATPAFSGDFANGAWSGLVTVNRPGTNVVLRFSDNHGHIGSSSLITVESGADLNLDGLPDAWQARYFAPGATNSGPNADPDHDGLTNLEEFLAGTNPIEITSAIRITDFNRAGTIIRLHFQSIAGRAYRVERARDAIAGPWLTVQDMILGTGASIEVVDQPATGETHLFYRVRLLQ